MAEEREGVEFVLGREQVAEDLRLRGHLEIHTRRWRLETRHSCDVPCMVKNDPRVFSYPDFNSFIPMWRRYEAPSKLLGDDWLSFACGSVRRGCFAARSGRRVSDGGRLRVGMRSVAKSYRLESSLIK